MTCYRLGCVDIVVPHLKASIKKHTRLYNNARERGDMFIMDEQEGIIDDFGLLLKSHVGLFPFGTPDFTEKHHRGE